MRSPFFSREQREAVRQGLQRVVPANAHPASIRALFLRELSLLEQVISEAGGFIGCHIGHGVALYPRHGHDAHEGIDDPDAIGVQQVAGNGPAGLDLQPPVAQDLGDLADRDAGQLVRTGRGPPCL